MQKTENMQEFLNRKKPFFQKVREYYPNYLLAHTNIWNRRLHLLGNIATIIYIVLSLLYLPWYLLFLTPFIIYPFAWSGHKWIERNKPATWSVNPLITKCCDWMMMWDMISNIGIIKVKYLIHEEIEL